MVIYLAGNIHGLEREDCEGWRKRAKEKLDDYDIKTFSPIRGNSIDMQGYDCDDLSGRGAVQRDLGDIDNADLVLAKMDFPGIGTSMEIMYAGIRHKPVLLITTSDKVKNHYWIRYFATRIFSNLEDALDYIIAYWL